MAGLLHITTDAAAVNAVVNHPAVRPFVGSPDEGEIDLSELTARAENLFLLGEHGGFALYWTAPFTREVHTFVLPKGRGAWARDAAGEGIVIAVAHGTAVLWTRIPPGLPNVRAYAVRMGMRPTGEIVAGAAIYAMSVR